MKKLYWSLLSSALLSIAILGWLIDAFSQQTHTPEDEFYLQSKLLTGFAKQIASKPAKERAQFTQSLATDFNLPLNYRLTNSLALPASLVAQMYSSDGIILEDQQGYYLLYSNKPLADYHLKLRLEKSHSQPQQNDLLLTLLFYTCLCILMGFIISPLAKRLNVLNSAAKKFASGDLTARIQISHFTYIKDVELTFNRMASQIEKLLDENKLMASSLSHDIRTPIACLRFGLDAALDSQDHEKIQHYLSRMETDLDQMESMLKSYLAFATLEQRANQLTYSHSELKPYINNLVQQVTPTLTKQQITLAIQNDEAIIYADLHWLARAITNLITNASDFAHKQILVTAKNEATTLTITVEDDGPGIDKKNWHKVFSPFYQEQSHRNRAHKSFGLGLAIVAKVVDWHHGSVNVSQSNSLGGACFTLKIHNPSKF